MRLSRTLKLRLRRYSELMSTPALADKELRFPVDDATFLIRQGALKNLNNAGALKNRAVKSLPQDPGAAELAAAIQIAKAKP